MRTEKKSREEGKEEDREENWQEVSQGGREEGRPGRRARKRENALTLQSAFEDSGQLTSTLQCVFVGTTCSIRYLHAVEWRSFLTESAQHHRALTQDRQNPYNIVQSEPLQSRTDWGILIISAD